MKERERDFVRVERVLQSFVTVFCKIANNYWICFENLSNPENATLELCNYPFNQNILFQKRFLDLGHKRASDCVWTAILLMQ